MLNKILLVYTTISGFHSLGGKKLLTYFGGHIFIGSCGRLVSSDLYVSLCNIKTGTQS